LPTAPSRSYGEARPAGRQVKDRSSITDRLLRSPSLAMTITTLRTFFLFNIRVFSGRQLNYLLTECWCNLEEEEMVMKKIVLLISASILSLVLFSQRYPGNTYISSQEKLNDEYCSGVFKTYDGTIIDLVNENESAKSYLNILEWLQGRVAGLQIYYTRYGLPVPFIRNTRASIFVDEMPWMQVISVIFRLQTLP
jgi:hypothetical protein